MLSENKNIFVTGAGDSVGLALALRVINEGGQAHVLDVNKDAVKAALAQNPGLTGTVGSAGDFEDLERAFSEAERAMGHVDIVANLVGVAGPIAPIDETPLDAWLATMDINLNSAFYTIKRAVPGMKARGRGVILNFSTTAVSMKSLHRASYTVSKAGIEKLTYAAAHELGPFGIRCNAIRPGAINGPRIERVLTGKAESLGVPVDELRKKWTEDVATRTFIDPEELVDMCMYLISPAAKNITGEVIAVSGADS